MKFKNIRKSGVLLHPTSLPGQDLYGDIGPDAFRFIDDLSQMGQSLWQILPIGPVDQYNSPYSSTSTFAGNELLISLDLLVEDDLLDQKYLNEFRSLDKVKTSFTYFSNYKKSLLKQIAAKFGSNANDNIKDRFNTFCKNESYWLDDYVQFCVLKDCNSQKQWFDWTNFNYSSNEITIYKIIQFLFDDQWKKLKRYCNSKNIKIIGDMPIYVGYDSADVYYNKELFQLNDSGLMKFKAGCPPCNYQQKGQVWGNPVYDWTNHKQSNFNWWRQRFNRLLDMVDIIRLDHFIGYQRFYKIPINDATAENGHWDISKGDELFDSLASIINNDNIIAEDLGDITPEVIKLRDKYEFSGMEVFQFDFNPYISYENSNKNLVVYTGTHDNDTIIGWFNSLDEKNLNSDKLSKANLLDYFNCNKSIVNWEIINYVMSLNNYISIIPIQDILSLDSSSRFNIPGILSENNWKWKMEEHLNNDVKNRLMELTIKNNRKI
tara:strand:+ start:2421 stop:3890 length:1470 start_codon:yes stop_codon:yes gene_type:complete